MGTSSRDATPRWPAADNSLYTVSGWSTEAPTLEGRPGVAFISRYYSRTADGTRVLLAVSTSTASKSIYRAGADVPFLGSGYVVTPASSEIVQPGVNRDALSATRGDQAWLQISAFGERRGLLGNGALAWGLSVLDGLAGWPNDYYLVRVMVPLRDSRDASSARAASDLATELFPRLAAWYGS